jgi:hypothetical protein
MGLWNKLFGGADGSREAMRDSYARHVRLAKNGQIQIGSESPHTIGLHGALGTRSLAGGIQVRAIWDELAPFLSMEEQAAVDALAEYVIYQERPKDTQITWLSEMINAALQNPTTETHRKLAALGVMNQVAWCALLTSNTMKMIEGSIDELRQEHESK